MTITNNLDGGRNGKINFSVSHFSTVLLETDKTERK